MIPAPGVLAYGEVVWILLNLGGGSVNLVGDPDSHTTTKPNPLTNTVIFQGHFHIPFVGSPPDKIRTCMYPLTFQMVRSHRVYWRIVYQICYDLSGVPGFEPYLAGVTQPCYLYTSSSIVGGDNRLILDPICERVTGIEPAFLTWKDSVLPLHHTRRQDEHSKD